MRLAERYRFDGVLIILPGRPPDIRSSSTASIAAETEDIVTGATAAPRACRTTTTRITSPSPIVRLCRPSSRSIRTGCSTSSRGTRPAEVPVHVGFRDTPRAPKAISSRPTARNDQGRVATGRRSALRALGVFSPFSQLLELIGYDSGLVALMDDEAKVHACLAADRRRDRPRAASGRLRRRGCADLAAFAGSGVHRRPHYEQFVLPYERRLVAAIKAHRPNVFVYTHTCGAIGDRLDLMIDTGTNGIDTLDPPPLGTVDLEQAKQTLAGHTFIKGNIDPVNTLLKGDDDTFARDVRWRLQVGKPGGGYILSSACSVAPRVRPERWRCCRPGAYGRFE